MAMAAAMTMMETYLFPSSCSPGEVWVGVGPAVESATAVPDVSCPLRPGSEDPEAATGSG